MTYGTNFYNNQDFKNASFSNDSGITSEIGSCNASPDEEALQNEKNKQYNVEDGDVSGIEGRLKSKLRCPSITRLRVEKIEGGLMVAGVVVAANCQIALPTFGFLFVLVGAVLTAASYRGPGENEDINSYAARIAFTGNSRILGPICIVVGAVMFALGAVLCVLTRRARKRQRRIGFHCPLHGDFYPLSTSQCAKLVDKKGWKRMVCLRGDRRLSSQIGPPQCPHSKISSTRSSITSGPLSPCPVPMPFLVTSSSISRVNAAANMLPDQAFGSIRSLSVTREIASFPMSRTPTPTRQRQSAIVVDPEVVITHEPTPDNVPNETALVEIQAAPQRKSVSIVCPAEIVQ